GIKVDVLHAGKVVASGTTNDKGVFQADVPKNVGYKAVVLARVGSQTIVSDAYLWSSSRPSSHAMVYTDRPVYRPSQKVFVKVIARHLLPESHEEVYRSQAGEDVRLRVTDPKGTQLYKGTLKTNEFGTVDASFSLPAEAPLGRYRVMATYVGRSFTAYFHIEEYRKPEFKVSVQVDKGYVVGGTPLKVSAEAKYYFGQPVQNATVTYTVYRKNVWRPRYFCGFYSWYWSPYGYGSRYRGRFVKRGSGKVDEKGRFSITIPTEKTTVDQQYTVEVGVTDQSRRQVSGSGTFKVTRGDFYLQLATDKYAYGPGETVVTTVYSKNHGDKPISTPVTVIVDYRHKDGWRYSDARQWRQMYSKQLTTGKDGAAIYRWTPDAEGYFRIRVTAKDRFGNEIETQRTLWHVSNNWSSSYSYSGLNLVLDKDSYRLGDTATVVMTTGFRNAYALLTYEGESIQRYEVVQFKGNTLSFRHKVTRRDMPNVRVVVSAIAENRFVSTYKMLVVPPAEYFLDVELVSDKKAYEPGETAVVKVRLRDAKGRPVVGELSLGVVDEAIYAIKSDSTPDIRKHFYGMRAHRVTTYHSLYFWSRVQGGLVLAQMETRSPMSPAPMVSKPGSGRRMKKKSLSRDREDTGVLVEPTLRKDFADTAFWTPKVVTDANGRATVRYKVPDNLTAWRLTARVVTKNTRVGVTTATTLSKKDLLVRLHTPRTLTERDVVTISGVVHNYLSHGKKVHVDLKTSGVELLGPSTRIVQVPANGEQRVDFKARVKGPKTSRFRLSARTNEKSDAMQLDVRVLPFGVRQVASKAGSVKETLTSTLRIPSSASTTTASLRLVFSPSVAATMMDALEYLVGFPYGCVEQTMSRLLPNVIVAQVLDKLKIENRELRQKLPKMVRKGTDRLFELQHSDGGWGWWKTDATHPYMTAYALYGLTMAKKAGYEIDDYKLRRGANRLKQLIASEKQLSTVAFMAYSLSFHDKVDPKVLERLYDARKTLNAYAKALAYMTLKRQGMPKKARAILAELEDSATIGRTTAYWKGKAWHYSWMDNQIETTAYVLRALVMDNPRNRLIPLVVNYLVTSRNGNRWTSTKDTAAVVYAFGDFLQATGELDADYTFSVKVNGKVVRSARITRENLVTFRGTTLLDGVSLRRGDNRIEVTKKGRGALYYSFYLTYFNQAERLKPTGSGMTIKREYFRILVEKDDAGKQTIREIPYDGGAVKSGEELRVRLTLEAAKDYQYLMVEDYIPSGCEIKKETARPRYGYHWRRRYYRPRGYDNRELRDDRMVFFLTNLRSGTTTFTYTLRAETPGRFRTLPTYAELMYHPYVSATSSDLPITIVD
ncbi:MAG: hypothetical protein KC609_20910, partial [Myxococcales bacterium]|nr:hypothetical protein [Myxococcales bacterium]